MQNQIGNTSISTIVRGFFCKATLMFPILKTNMDNLEQNIHKIWICLIFLTRFFWKETRWRQQHWDKSCQKVCYGGTAVFLNPAQKHSLTGHIWDYHLSGFSWSYYVFLYRKYLFCQFHESLQKSKLTASLFGYLLILSLVYPGHASCCLEITDSLSTCPHVVQQKCPYFPADKRKVC